MNSSWRFSCLLRLATHARCLSCNYRWRHVCYLCRFLFCIRLRLFCSLKKISCSISILRLFMFVSLPIPSGAFSVDLQVGPLSHRRYTYGVCLRNFCKCTGKSRFTFLTCLMKRKLSWSDRLLRLPFKWFLWKMFWSFCSQWRLLTFLCAVGYWIFLWKERHFFICWSYFESGALCTWYIFWT
jgi:hypothetical protein